MSEILDLPIEMWDLICNDMGIRTLTNFVTALPPDSEDTDCVQVLHEQDCTLKKLIEEEIRKIGSTKRDFSLWHDYFRINPLRVDYDRFVALFVKAYVRLDTGKANLTILLRRFNIPDHHDLLRDIDIANNWRMIGEYQYSTIREMSYGNANAVTINNLPDFLYQLALDLDLNPKKMFNFYHAV